MEVDTRRYQAGEAAEVGKQHAIDQKARAVVDHDRRLAHRARIGHRGGDGGRAALRATNHLDQRHHVHRVEEVHAAEVFRPLQRRCQQIDRNGRGVGGQDGVRPDLPLHLGEHRLLDLGVLDHRLDHQVDLGEIAVRQRRADRVERLGHLRRGQAALLHPIAEQLGRFVEAELDGFLADVLEQDRRALDRRLVGNAAAHDAGAEHGGQLHRAGVLVIGAGLALERLVVEEQADQTARHFGLGQLDQPQRLDLQRLVAAVAGRLLDGLDRLHRRRIVRPGLAGHVALGTFEGHHLFELVELELLQLGLATRPMIELASHRPTAQIQRRLAQPCWGDHRIDHADLQRSLRIVFLAAGDPLDSVIGADQPR
ncbi:hypothetical protein D3C75_719220 [compost metagenome]